MNAPVQPPLNPSLSAPPTAPPSAYERASPSASPSASPTASLTAPALSIVVPTYCEHANIRPFTAGVAEALKSEVYEIIFVDDDSPDGTAEEVLSLAREGAPVRCVRRIGRRGLSSAVVEGVLAASADLVAVMDADLQHDETLLPRMLHVLRSSDVDVVVASRLVEGGGFGGFSAGRQRMSRFATRMSRLLIGGEVADPMSGFFMTRRGVFNAVVYDLTQHGYKILLDILTASPRPLKVAELPYVFRERQAGSSKVEALIVLEYAFLIIDKLSGGLVPARFVLFGLVGLVGLGVHLAVLGLALQAKAPFVPAQAAATLAAMTSNFLLNNMVTYRTERLRGGRLVVGYLIFCAVCSIGAFANISVADVTMMEVHSWPVAGVAGALMSAVFNFGVTTRFVWGRTRRPRRPTATSVVVDA